MRGDSVSEVNHILLPHSVIKIHPNFDGFADHGNVVSLRSVFVTETDLLILLPRIKYITVTSLLEIRHSPLFSAGTVNVVLNGSNKKGEVYTKRS